MKARYIIPVLSVAAILGACESDLEVTPISSVSEESFYRTASDIEQAVVAVYDALQDKGQYGLNYVAYTEFRSDDADGSITADSGVFGDIELFQESSNNVLFEETWNSCYKGIQRCNIVLSRIDDIEIDQSRKETLLGEVKFIRALTYFNLVRLFGNVPLVTEETTDPFDFFSIGRTPVGQVYDQIIQDLEEASIQLPTSTPEVGRATNGAAFALLGKVYLTLGRWENSMEALNRVNGYSLNDNFADNFGIANENGPESIFEVQFQAGNGEGSIYPNEFVGDNVELIGGIGSTGYIGGPSIDLFNSFEEADLRRNVSILLNEAGELFALKLIDIPQADLDSDLNVIVLRYADVLLMKAEALNELGYSPDGEAFNLLNQIRNRAGLLSLSATDLPNQEGFRQAVYRERRHEFVSEFSRWFDLVRTGRAIEVMNGVSDLFDIQGFQLLFPIPLTAIDTMNDPDIFPQNPGY